MARLDIWSIGGKLHRNRMHHNGLHLHRRSRGRIWSIGVLLGWVHRCGRWDVGPRILGLGSMRAVVHGCSRLRVVGWGGRRSDRICHHLDRLSERWDRSIALRVSWAGNVLEARNTEDVVIAVAEGNEGDWGGHKQANQQTEGA